MVFFEDDVVETMVKVLGISETAARNWFNGTEEVDLSVGQLVDEIKEYVDSKPEGFRLLFMIDEAGQYIGTNTSMLLNLQSLIEKIGSVCRGQVWIVATGQEALDDMIKVRQDEFSRIMARFAVNLSLTSSSVDEVIEKRLLTKTDEAEKTLKMVYDNNDSVLRNLYSFDTENKDICGYSTEAQFVRVFPFVPYQFILMQKVFNEIRKHGHAGKHQSSGERSMLNGFQESAQKVQNRNELSIVPLYEFYDTLHSFLDTAVRSVIERAERVAENNQGLTEKDVKLLKLLYLMEERMALKYHVPFIGIPFEVWQAGPVAKDVFIDLSDGPFLLKSFVKTDFRDGGTFIEAIADFDDSEFSECEIEMMDEILVKYGNMKASELVSETHKEGTLWYRTAARSGLLDAFNKHECNNSDLQINFEEAMPDCAAEDYRESLNIRQTANLLNAGNHV